MPTAAGIFCGQALGHGDGGFGVGRALHVDADEGVDRGGVGDHLADDALGEGWVEVHADLREFDADVGVELAGFDGVEELVVDVGGFLRFGFGGDALAEGVEGGGDAFLVDALADGEDFFDRHAGDETAGHLSADGGALGEGTKRFVL